jgi:hypothetical protein
VDIGKRVTPLKHGGSAGLFLSLRCNGGACNPAVVSRALLHHCAGNTRLDITMFFPPSRQPRRERALRFACRRVLHANGVHLGLQIIFSMSRTIFAHSTEPWDFLADFVRGVSNTHPVAIEEADRLYHLALIGKTGVGKSTLLLNLMYADLLAGRGFGLFDPHGDLTEQLLDRVPRGRIEDVVYFNPADLEFPVPFNISRPSTKRSITLSPRGWFPFSNVFGAMKRSDHAANTCSATPS